MPKLHTTHEPEVERDVSDAEAADLTAWGLVLDTKATTDLGRQKAAERQTAASTTEQPEG